MPVSPRRRALLALSLLAPVPSLATYVALIGMPGPVGAAAFMVGKIWILLLPWAWTRWIERPAPRAQAAAAGVWWSGIWTGCVLGLSVVGAYLVFGASLLQGDFIAGVVARAGLDGPGRFLLGAAYWIFFNSLLEEYVWRGFVGRQAECLLGRVGGIWLAALLFALHHVVAVRAYAPWSAALLAGLGVCLAGAVWSWLYARTRTLLAPYISHVLADVAIFALAYSLIFGAS